MSIDTNTIKHHRTIVEVFFCTYHVQHLPVPVRFTRSCKAVDCYEGCSVTDCDATNVTSWYHTILLPFVYALDD